MKTSMNLFASAAFFGSFAVASSASATTYALHGSSCVPLSPTGNVTYNQNGISNNSTTSSLAVNCPITVNEDLAPFTQIKMILDGYNRNSSVSSSCTVSATDRNGLSPVNGQAFLTGNHSGSLEASPVTINLGTSVFYSTFYVTCVIAPRTSSGGSWITEVSLFTTP
jgi:hypothetical protein